MAHASWLSSPTMHSEIICETTKVIHVTYSAPARLCQRRLRVFPAENRGSQRILKLQWRCTPQPDATQLEFDEFGNPVLEIRHKLIPRDFRFELQFTSARRSHSCAVATGLPPVGVGAFVSPSTLCDLTPSIREFAGNAPDAASICARAYAALKYEEGITDNTTTASRVLSGGAGLCQDFAHLMIAACRAAKIPARYISGYNTAEGRMHAWVEALKNGEWQAWDPTHNRPTRPDCVVVASGRDARDVQPVSGTYRGRAQAHLRTWCKTTVIDSSPPVVAASPVEVELNG